MRKNLCLRQPSFASHLLSRLSTGVCGGRREILGVYPLGNAPSGCGARSFTRAPGIPQLSPSPPRHGEPSVTQSEQSEPLR